MTNVWDSGVCLIKLEPYIVPINNHLLCYSVLWFIVVFINWLLCNCILKILYHFVFHGEMQKLSRLLPVRVSVCWVSQQATRSAPIMCSLYLLPAAVCAHKSVLVGYPVAMHYCILFIEPFGMRSSVSPVFTLRTNGQIRTIDTWWIWPTCQCPNSLTALIKRRIKVMKIAFSWDTLKRYARFNF